MTTFEDILRDYRIESRREGQHHHAVYGWIQFDCPHCSPKSGRFRMGYNIARRNLNCWVCGPHGLVDTVSLLTGEPVKRVLSLLGDLAHPVHEERPQRRGTLKLPRGRVPLLPQHRRYLEKRGFDPDEIVQLWGVEGIGVDTRYGWRLFIPAHLDDEVVSWTTRSICDTNSARYKSAPHEMESVSLKQILYGEQYCRHAIIVNEGPLDAWAIGPGAVATCGVSFTREQVYRMTRYTVRVIVFDKENQAQKRAKTLVEQLSIFPGETYNVVLSGKDASRSPKRELAELRRRFLN